MENITSTNWLWRRWSNQKLPLRDSISQFASPIESNLANFRTCNLDFTVTVLFIIRSWVKFFLSTTSRFANEFAPKFRWKFNSPVSHPKGVYRSSEKVLRWARAHIKQAAAAVFLPLFLQRSCGRFAIHSLFILLDTQPTRVRLMVLGKLILGVTPPSVLGRKRPCVLRGSGREFVVQWCTLLRCL